MYARAEECQERSDPEYAYINRIRGINMAHFFREYESRLSKTVQKRLAELKAYIAAGAGNGATARKAVKALLSAKGRESPETAGLANFAVNLWRRFEHKGAVTAAEFISLICRYG
jgi:HEPN domain-containing protein